MRRYILALALATCAIPIAFATPAIAQSRSEVQRDYNDDVNDARREYWDEIGKADNDWQRRAVRLEYDRNIQKAEEELRDSRSGNRNYRSYRDNNRNDRGYSSNYNSNDVRREFNEDLREAKRQYDQNIREARQEYSDATSNRRAYRSYRNRTTTAYNSNFRNYDYNRYEPGQNGYYPDRYYSVDNSRAERRLGRNDRVYRGSDGRYYCRHEDGTTGLVIGAIAGGILGNQIDNGRSSILGTLLGAGAGAILGREIDKGNVRCK